jgi:hypothetical protein
MAYMLSNEPAQRRLHRREAQRDAILERRAARTGGKLRRAITGFPDAVAHIVVFMLIAYEI